MTDNLLATCRHEAAHAVIAEHYGIRVTRIVIYDDGDSGVVMHDQRFKGGPVIRSILALAGTSAEQLWHGMSYNLVSSGDCDFVREAIEPCGRDWDVLFELSRLLVKQHRNPIFRVARVLMKTRVLTGVQLRVILED